MSRTMVLVIEDEPSIRESVGYALRTEGIDFVAVSTVGAARRILADTSVSLIVLDVGLPDGNGFDFCREIRGTFLGPVLFLTARSSEVDRIVGLEIGGGDYVTKPFSPRELTARIRNLLRLARVAPLPEEKEARPSRSMGLRVDGERARVSLNGQEVIVSASEFRLLETLVARPGRVYSRDHLMEAAWEDPGASLERTIDSHVKNLRAKFRQIDPGVEVIRTHRGLGYSLNPEQWESQG
ncbi:MAG: response regulator [Puniceicoccales bacterium]